MKQLEEKKRRTEEDKERRKLERQREHVRKRSLHGLQNDVERRTREFDKKVCNLPPPPPHTPQTAHILLICAPRVCCIQHSRAHAFWIDQYTELLTHRVIIV